MTKQEQLKRIVVLLNCVVEQTLLRNWHGGLVASWKINRSPETKTAPDVPPLKTLHQYQLVENARFVLHVSAARINEGTSAGINTTGNQTDPLLILPIDSAGFKLWNTHTLSVICQSLFLSWWLFPDPLVSPFGGDVTGPRGQTQDTGRQKMKFHFHQSRRSSKVCHGERRRLAANK